MNDQSSPVSFKEENYWPVLEKYHFYCAYCRFNFLKDPTAFLDIGFDVIHVGTQGNVAHLILACPHCRSLNPASLAADVGTLAKDTKALREHLIKWKFYEMRQKYRGV